MKVFVPAFETLAGHIRGRVRYPTEFDRMGKEERKEFKVARPCCLRIPTNLPDGASALRRLPSLIRRLARGPVP